MSERVRAAVERLRDQHRRGADLAPLGPTSPADLGEAYAVQDAFHLGRMEAGDAIAGWKIALTTPVMQEFVGIDHPLAGAIFASSLHQSGATLSAGRYVHLGVESEIAIRIGEDVPPAAGDYDRKRIAPYVAACMAGTEVVDDRNCSYKPLDPLLLAADNAFNAGCVVGPENHDWRSLDLARVRGTMRINGAAVGEGVGGDVLGHPLEALAWLANHLIGRGRRLRAGDVVLTGSVVATRWPEVGDEMTTEIESLGRATLSVGR